MCPCKDVMNGRTFFSSDHLENIQGGHIFKRLKSLSFPWDFQGIFKFFPEQLKREKFAAIHFYLQLCYIPYIFPKFSWFFFKNSNFPEFSLRFWHFFKFPEFSRFVATLIWLKIIKNPGQLKFTDLPHGILFCQERPGILEGTHKLNFFHTKHPLDSFSWCLIPPIQSVHPAKSIF